MKLNGVLGEFASKALAKRVERDQIFYWQLTDEYFLSKEEAKAWQLEQFDCPEIKWPVEVFEDGLIYVPDPEEIK